MDGETAECFRSRFLKFLPECIVDQHSEELLVLQLYYSDAVYVTFNFSLLVTILAFQNKSLLLGYDNNPYYTVDNYCKTHTSLLFRLN